MATDPEHPFDVVSAEFQACKDEYLARLEKANDPLKHDKFNKFCAALNEFLIAAWNDSERLGLDAYQMAADAAIELWDTVQRGGSEFKHLTQQLRDRLATASVSA